MRPEVRLSRPKLNKQCYHDIVLDISVTNPSNKSSLTKRSDIHAGGTLKIINIIKLLMCSRDIRLSGTSIYHPN
jgi:hypothetical protein